MNKQTFTLHPTTFDIQLCTWQESFQHYLDSDYRKITHRQLSDKSIKLAIQHVRVFGVWYEEKFNQAFIPGNLTNYDLQLYRKWSLGQEKVKAATWNSRHWALGILCMWIAIPDLMDGVDQKSQVRASTKHRSLTDDEYHRLVHALEQDPHRAVTVFENQSAIRNWAAVSLMLHAGLRVEEVSLVTAGDITINDRSGNVLVRNGKGSKERTVPLNLIARRAIASYLDLKPVSVTLFDLSTRSLQRTVSDIGHHIGVPDVTPHWLRYTFAKRLEGTGQSIETIRDLLGHNSIETTRRYLRSSMADLQSAVDGAM
jgi:integrase/recombinase XerD